jgi:integral membrane protein (TIGR01906 family)
LNIAVRLIATLTVPLALLMTNVLLMAGGPFVGWEYARPGFPQAVGMTDEKRLELSLPSARFIADRADPQSLAALEVGGEPLYTAAEISHLQDVRRLVRRASLLAAVGLAVVVLAAVAWRDTPERRAGLIRAIEAGGWLTAMLVVLVGAGIAVAWPLFFVGFHELFFQPGTWSFASDSGLIKLYPEQFWFDVSVALAAVTALEGVVIGLAGRRAGARVAAG